MGERILIRGGHVYAGSLCHWPHFFDLAGVFCRAQIAHQNFDAGFVDVVAATIEVIDANDCFAISEYMLPFEMFSNNRSKNGCSS